MNIPLVVSDNNISKLLSTGIALAPTPKSPTIVSATSDPTNVTPYTYGRNSSLRINNTTGKIWVATTPTISPYADPPPFWVELFPQFTSQAVSTAGNALANGVTTFIDFPTTQNDTTSSFTGQGGGNNVTYTNTCRYVVPYDGIYFMSFILEITPVAAAGGLIPGFYKSGALFKTGCTRPDPLAAAAAKRLEGSNIAYLLAGDVISIGVAVATSVGGATQSVTGENNRFCIWCLGETTSR